MDELRYALYARKSSENDDKQAQSIEDQVSIMTDKAAVLGLNVVTTIEETRSAKSPNTRPKFMELIELIKSGDVNAILCWEINRLSRNPQESGIISQLLQDGHLKVIQTNEKTYSPEDNAIILSVDTSMASQFITDLRRNVKRGIKFKLEHGQMSGKAPIGYLNDREYKVVIPDPERFALVRKLWDMLLTGQFQVSEIARYAAEDLLLETRRTKQTGGKPMTVPGMYEMFKNPFYYGWIRYNDNLYKGDHEPMITESEFDAAQRLIRPHTKEKLSLKLKSEPFAFRGLIHCGECGCLITYTLKTRHYKNGKTQDFEYCYCPNRKADMNCRQRATIKPEALNTMIRNELIKYTIHEDFFNWATDQLDSFYDAEASQRQAITMHQARAITSLENDIKELTRMRYKRQIEDDYYNAEKLELEKKLKQLNKEFNAQQDDNLQWRKEADRLFNFARYAKEDFDSDDDSRKRDVLAIVGENLTLLDGKLNFQPIKYLVPIAEANQTGLLEDGSVVTYSDHIKTAPGGTANKLWYTRTDSNRRPSVPKTDALIR